MPFTAPKTWSTGETLTAANFNTYIRDNQLSFGPHLIVRKTSDESLSSNTTLQDDDQLLTPSIAANEIWQLTLFVRFQGTPGNLKHSFSFPTGGTLVFTSIGANVASTNFAQSTEITASDGAAHDITGASTPRVVIIEAIFLNSTTPGAVTYRWAQNTSSGTATIVKANSTLWGVKLA
jgi:hypothetical protein